MEKLRTQIYRHINELDAKLWQTAVPGEFFFSYPFLRLLSESRVENALYRYLIFSFDNKPVGAAVLSHFILQLDLLTGDKTIAFLKSIFPRLFQISMVCCGLPVSYGQRNFFFNMHELKQEAIAKVHKEMLNFASEVNADLLLWKEFNPSEQVFPFLKEMNYVALPTLPDNKVFFQKDNLQDFLQSLRSPYRRKFRDLLPLFSLNGTSWQQHHLLFEETPFTETDTDEFYRGYMKLMARTHVKLEIYPKEFFHLLAREKGLNTRLLKFTNTETEEKLTALVIPNQNVLYFVLISKPQANYEGPFYRLFMQVIVLYALKMGYEVLHMGQTSYYAKMCAGARPWRLETYILMRKKWKQKLMQKWGHLLFPEIELPAVHPYNNSFD